MPEATQSLPLHLILSDKTLAKDLSLLIKNQPEKENRKVEQDYEVGLGFYGPEYPGYFDIE